MENANNLNEQNIKGPGEGCNETGVPSLEEVESNISMLMNHNDVPASDNFRDNLKTRVLEAHAKNNMPRFSGFKNFSGLFTVRRFSFAVAIVLLIAVVSGVIMSGYFGGKGQLARIFINPAYAADDFSLTALAGDSTGVTPDSAYKLTSKESFSTASIKAGLTTTPDVKVSVKQTADKEWVITPGETLPPNALLKIALAATVDDNGTQTTRDFSWAFQVKDNFRVLNSLPGNAATGVPTNTGIEVTFSHPNLDGYENNFSISPAVKGSFEYHARTAVFVPTEPLADGALYTVTVGAALGLTGSSEKLGADYKFSFETAAKSASSADQWFVVNDTMLQFRSGETPFIGVYGDTAVQTSVNVYSFASADAFLAGLAARDEFPRWSQKWSEYRYDVTGLPSVAAFSPKIQTQDYANFISFPSALPIGFYLAEVNYQGKISQVWIQVNDLDVYYNIDASRTLVWVNRVGASAPVAGADISAGDLVQNVQTDTNGTAAFDVPPAYTDPKGKYADQPIYLIVRAGPSVAIASFDPGSGATNNPWSYFYTDRPRYQSTDDVHFWVMTRDRATGTAPAGQYSVVLRKSGWYDYYYNPEKISEVSVTPDAYGTMTGDIPLKDLKPDSYEVALVRDGKDVSTRWISVLPYVKPAYSITVTPDRAAVFADQQVNFTAEAKFFDGTPAADLKMNVSEDGGASEGTYTTDEQGKFVFTITKQYNETEYWPKSVGYTVAPAAAELGDITGYASATWYGARVYATANVNYPDKGVAELDLKVRNIDLNKINNGGTFSYDDGWQGADPAAGAVISGEVDKISYDKVETGTAYDFINKTSYKTYRYDQHTDKVDVIALTSAADGTANYRRTVSPGEFYQIIYSVADPLGRKEQHTDYFYYYDGNTYYRDYFATGGDNAEPTLEFNRSDRTYSLGDTVKATLSLSSGPVAPTGSGDRFLFAKYQNGLKNWTVQTSPVYSFNFAPSDIPNVQLFAAWWDGKSYHTTQTDGWWGNSDGGAKYNYTDRELTIDAAFDKATYAPGDAADIKLTVKDKNGKPVRASVNLNMIDEAYYAVAPDSSNPLQTIYTPLYSGIIASVETQAQSPAATQGGAERGGCFAGGTMITMADGSKKAIEKIKVGDLVATLANPLTSEVVSGTVSATFAHASNKMIYINGGLLKATPEHMIYASGTFKTAGEIKPGDVLIGLDGKKTVVTKTEIVFEKIPVYNLRVDPYHTFIANGIYVHNDKDGTPRQNFVDVALFKTVETDDTGRAEVTMKLPDNVTTWRLTSQAIGQNLEAGIALDRIKATLPAFVDVTVGKNYLAGDQVTAKLRAFGAALTATDAVSYAVTSPSLGNASFSYKADSKAYVATEVKLPPLPAGNFDVTYAMKSAKGNDAVKLPVNAVTSFMRVNKILSTADVTSGMQFSAAGASGPVRITFADASAMHLYGPLVGLAYSWGKRVDQTLAHAVAADLLLKYYGEKGYDNAFDGSAYQQADGGIALLPYGSSDMDLSARLAALTPEKFDAASLRQYFFAELDAANATPETVSDALLGLASLNDPVLPRLEIWKTRVDLSDESKMRVALALYKMGAYEDSRAVYNDVLKHGEKRGAYYLLSGSDPSATLANTAFLAELAAALNMPERDNLWAYVADHENDSRIDILTNLEDLSYTEFAIPTLAPGPSKVSYEVNGVKNTIDLNGWGDGEIAVAASDLGQVKIDAVEGKISAVVSADAPVSPSEIVPSPDVSITRTYTLKDDQPVTDFKDGDIVHVTLAATISRNSPDNNYQITDILPAGLVPVTNLIDPYLDGYSPSWVDPFDINGQLVSFNVWKMDKPDSAGNYHAYINYFARVITKGTYKAEPAVIQGFADPGTINLTPASSVTIQ